MRNTREMRDAAYSRREMVLLFAGFLVFLSGIPGRSEVWVESASTTARHLIQLVLVFLGLVTPTVPTAIKPQIKMLHPAPAPVVKVKPSAPELFAVNTHSFVHHYTYQFEGKATLHGQPCANASVLVRLVSGDTTLAKGTVTEADGTYILKVGIDVQDDSAVDWALEAYTADFDKVELSGRQIVKREQMDDPEPITVNTPVDFVISSAK